MVTPRSDLLLPLVVGGTHSLVICTPSWRTFDGIGPTGGRTHFLYPTAGFSLVWSCLWSLKVFPWILHSADFGSSFSGLTQGWKHSLHFVNIGKDMVCQSGSSRAVLSRIHSLPLTTLHPLLSYWPWFWPGQKCVDTFFKCQSYEHWPKLPMCDWLISVSLGTILVSHINCTGQKLWTLLCICQPIPSLGFAGKTVKAFLN